VQRVLGERACVQRNTKDISNDHAPEGVQVLALLPPLVRLQPLGSGAPSSSPCPAPSSPSPAHAFSQPPASSAAQLPLPLPGIARHRTACWAGCVPISGTPGRDQTPSKHPCEEPVSSPPGTPTPVRQLPSVRESALVRHLPHHLPVLLIQHSLFFFCMGCWHDSHVLHTRRSLQALCPLWEDL